MNDQTAAAIPGPEPHHPDTAATGAAPGFARHRALIGWLPPDAAAGLLSTGRDANAVQFESLSRARLARETVAQRAADIDQTGLVAPVPAVLARYIEELRADPTNSMFAEGWDVASVDLPRVCAFQPMVGMERALERLEGIEDDDLGGIANVCLPKGAQIQLSVRTDAARNVIALPAPNLNVRVGRPFFGSVPGGAGPVAGFELALPNSVLQVARYRGRFFLRDGYHRAVALLSRGITWVPAFVRDVDNFELLVPFPAGMLPQDRYLGERPPTLADYLDEEVAADVLVEAPTRVITVHAFDELVPL
jgi:hypothetical protein